MSFSCGCDVVPTSRVTPEALRKHLVHTLETLLFWELVRPDNGHSPYASKIKLASARIAFMDAVAELYPETNDQSNIKEEVKKG